MKTPPLVAIIGPGRLGTGLARALVSGGWNVVVVGRNVQAEWKAHLAGRALVLIAVPDDSISEVAAALASAGAVGADQVVLHTSGARDRSLLKTLEGKAMGLGSFAPVQTVADPATAAERLRGAYAVLEGDPPAVEMGRLLADQLGMQHAVLSAEAKVAYHAGAVLVANLGVALEAMAERVAAAGGVPAEVAGRIYLPLWEGMVANLAAMGAGPSLTGPVRRGDVDTVVRHLAVLRGNEREAYLALSREALRLAERAGLEKWKVEEMAKVLGA
ncbi:MAG TPA: DUF2520 domain-containing protein [Gemmatimonadales bacterium]|nr:DUF2520 domain-containing protein [Gemmatimonadales bacterium]